MAARGPSKRIRGDFSLGQEAAEHDGLLLEAFYETWLYKAIASRTDKKCFLVGRTGSGKSAMFRRLEEDHPDHVIRLDPEDLSLQYITELGVIQKLSSLDVHLDPLFIALWKHVLVIEIIKHRYSIDSPGKKQRVFEQLKTLVRRDRSKQAALDYLQDFEGTFWQETDQRVKELTYIFEEKIRAELGAKADVGGLAGISSQGGVDAAESSMERTELVNRYQRIVNETQLPRLNQMVTILKDYILESSQHFTYILIDDLDRDWADSKVSNDLIRCLFRAVSDLKRVENLKILVALRTNIFESLDFGRSGGQGEKFRSLIHWIKWTKLDLKEVLDNRISVASRRHGFSIESVSELLPRVNSTRGDPLDHILARTLMRPRDAIAFLNQCFLLASGKERLTWNGIRSAEDTYSRERLLALRDEWDLTYPGIERALRMFGRSPHTMSWEVLIPRLDNCALLIYDESFPGGVWMESVSRLMWSGEDLEEQVRYQPLIKLLFNLGFIGFVRSKTETVRSERVPVDDPAIFSYDDPHHADHIANLWSAEAFVVHPAFRPALEIPEHN